jgi:hypothetical protein
LKPLEVGKQKGTQDRQVRIIETTLAPAKEVYQLPLAQDAQGIRIHSCRL